MKMGGKIITLQTFVITVFVFLAVIMPRFVFSFDVSTIITVLSLLFAILVGFFFATSTSNHLRLQTLIANENAALIALHNFANIIDKNNIRPVIAAIDTYMIAGLDHELLAFGPHVRKELRAIILAVDAITPTDERGLALLQTLHGAKNILWNTNQEISIAAKRVLARPHWVILGLLAGCIDVLLLSIRDGSIASTVFILLLIVASYLVLQLLHHVDTNRLLARQLSFDNPQEVFIAIGTLPYYPEPALHNHLVQIPTTPYRIGAYKDLSRSYDKTIRTVKPARKKQR